MRNLAIIGGGPAALMIYQRLVESGTSHICTDIFEASDRLGSGMPYSAQGAQVEHITNVSSDELPSLKKPVADWIKDLPSSTLKEFGIDRNDFHEKKVLPRLLFGQYLTAQFQALLDQSQKSGSNTNIHYATVVTDIRDDESAAKVVVVTDAGETFQFDYVIICTGHHWPTDHEGTVPGYFDSPYPPAKLARRFDHVVAVRGSSLTAVDAIRTMARHNGRFAWEGSRLVFHADENSQNFRVMMHSRQGLLPCIRVHMDEPHAASSALLPQNDIDENRQANNGFLALDFLFEQGFKRPMQDSDPAFYAQIKDMNLESFVEAMMGHRETIEPFELFKKEYAEASKSISQERPIYWKEMLSALSFAMNYPAKHLSAEDMLRLKKHLMPLISVVIAFVPQSSCEELLALHDAGRLELIADGDRGKVEISESGKIVYRYQQENGDDRAIACQTFVNCTGQQHLSIEAFPFRSLLEGGTVSEARLKFRSATIAAELLANGEKDIEKEGDDFYLRVPGAGISDNFQVLDRQGKPSERIYLMAVPYMGGFNPDYSGLDFCEHASELIVKNILNAS